MAPLGGRHPPRIEIWVIPREERYLEARFSPNTYPTSPRCAGGCRRRVLFSFIHRIAERNCLENRNELNFGVPGVGKTREVAPLLPLCASENTRSRPVQLSTKHFHKESSSKRKGFRI